MKKSPIPLSNLKKEIATLADVINNEPDFPCVLVISSYIDQALSSILSEYLIVSSTTNKLLNSSGGAIGTFSARCDLCYCLGLISKALYHNLLVIGDIRNYFAHSHLNIDFSDKQITDLCEKLTFPESNEIVGERNWDINDYIKGSRNRFVYVTLLMANRLILTGLPIVHCKRKIGGWESA
jgi:Mannitol repressor